METAEGGSARGQVVEDKREGADVALVRNDKHETPVHVNGIIGRWHGGTDAQRHRGS